MRKNCIKDKKNNKTRTLKVPILHRDCTQLKSTKSMDYKIV